MPKSKQEITATALAIAHWREFVGCPCNPVDGPKGLGYDLGCDHRHVELKGTEKARPGFRILTAAEFDAARKDPLFELWIVSDIHDGKGVFHIVTREEVLASAVPVLHWRLPLGASRLNEYRRHEVPKKAKRKRKR